MPRPSVACRDGSAAIAAAIADAWDEQLTQVNCWAHVVRNYEKKADSLIKAPKSATPEVKDEAKKVKSVIKGDIPRIQMCVSRPIFEKVTQLWIDEFKNIPFAEAFVEYFLEQYIANPSMSNWFEGAAPLNPSTNNANESGNQVYKRLFTLFRQGTILKVVNQNQVDVLPFWSKFRNENNKNFEQYHFKPAIVDYPEDTWGLASLFLKEMKNLKVRRDGSHFVWRKDFDNITEEEATIAIDVFKTRGWMTFTDFRTWQRTYDVWFPSDTIQCYMCTCKAFQKEYFCQHSVAFAQKRVTNRLQVPTCIKENLTKIEARCKRGRPKGDQAALTKEPIRVQPISDNFVDNEAVEPEEGPVKRSRDGDIIKCSCKGGCKVGGKGRKCTCRTKEVPCGTHCDCCNCTNTSV